MPLDYQRQWQDLRCYCMGESHLDCKLDGNAVKDSTVIIAEMRNNSGK